MSRFNSREAKACWNAIGAVSTAVCILEVRKANHYANSTTTYTHCQEATATTTTRGVDSFDKDSDTNNDKELRICGPWCQTAPKDTPCRIDVQKLPCRGTLCSTTAGLWNKFVLAPGPQRVVSCDLYKQGVAYPDRAAPCASCCHIPEINPQRYPQPTGLGVFCKPGTCRPAASPRHDPDSGLGLLTCPCNWFGSECTDTAVRMQSVTKATVSCLSSGREVVQLRLVMHDPDVRILRDYRPGCVVRLQQLVHHNTHDTHDKFNDGIQDIYELSCAVAHFERQNDFSIVELLVGVPHTYLDPHLTCLAQSLRSIPDGTHLVSYTENGETKKTTTADAPSTIQDLFVNPVISGFYNGRYQYLMDYLHNQSNHDNQDTTLNTKLSNVVMVATGSALAGVVSAVQAMLTDQESGVLARDMKIHVYYGIAQECDMAYRDKLQTWVQQGKIRLTIVESQSRQTNSDTSTSRLGVEPFYAQHAVAQDLKQGLFSASSSVFVACGHLEVLDAVRSMLPQHRRDTRFFLNI